MSDELGDECEELRLGIESVNKRNEIRRNFNKKVTLSYKSPDAKFIDTWVKLSAALSFLRRFGRHF